VFLTMQRDTTTMPPPPSPPPPVALYLLAITTGSTHSDDNDEHVDTLPPPFTPRPAAVTQDEQDDIREIEKERGKEEESVVQQASYGNGSVQECECLGVPLHWTVVGHYSAVHKSVVKEYQAVENEDESEE